MAKTWLVLVCAAVTSLGGCSDKPKTKEKNEPLLSKNIQNEPMHRLKKFATERDDYRIFVGIPTSKPTSWAVVSKVGEQEVVLEGGTPLAIGEVKAYVVAYPNGQVVESVEIGLAFPMALPD